MIHNVTIARSGIQYYTYDELPNLGLLSIPSQHKDKRVFAVYRPSYVVAESASKCADKPVVIGHEHWIDKNNESAYSIGRTLDNISIVYDNDEVVLKTKIRVDDSKLPSVSELSLGYTADMKWQSGASPNGEEFQIVCKGITDVNHLAIVANARGGAGLRILDGMKVRSGLLHFFRKFGKVQDATGSAFADAMNKLKMANQSESDVMDCINVLSACLRDLPISTEKAKLERFIADIPLLVGEADFPLILDKITELYNCLCRDALNDVLEEQQSAEMAQATQTNGEPITSEDKNMFGFNKQATPPEAAKPEVATETTETKTETPVPAQTAEPQKAADTASTTQASAEPPVAEATLNDVVAAINNLASLLKGVVAPKKEVADENAPDVSKTECKTQDACKDEQPKAEPKTEESKVGDSASIIETAVQTSVLDSVYTQSFETKETADELDKFFARIKGGR